MCGEAIVLRKGVGKGMNAKGVGVAHAVPNHFAREAGEMA